MSVVDGVPAPPAVRSREELLEQCEQELTGALDPLPRQLVSLSLLPGIF